MVLVEDVAYKGKGIDHLIVLKIFIVISSDQGALSRGLRLRNICEVVEREVLPCLA